MGRSLVVLCALSAACGRYGFTPLSSDAQGNASDGTHDGSLLGDGANGDSGSGSGSGSGSALPPVTYAGAAATFVGTTGNTQSFTITPFAAGDALVIMIGCAGSQTPTGATLTAPGWTFTPLSPITVDSGGQVGAASFGAIVPAAAPVTATMTFTSANCNRGKSALADEFGNTDPVAPFDTHAQANGAGNCTTTITTGANNEAIWGGCYAATSVTSPGAGYTKAAADTVGDFNEYKLTTDPAGTMETVVFNNPNGYAMVAATIKPAP